ncbi:Nucleophosmin [Saguinus oedipus]|uniref:Nucleophosmin n=1 Tax=Saguinus oedipus TaxID=9490 RepID=A0ABQ9U0A7_SAGOE|nr:Nucleophosmin [Saguinus oedipus]
MVSSGAGAKDELHIAEAEAMNYEGSPIKVTLATLKMFVQPMVSLGGLEITPAVILQLKCGSGPLHISGQHLVAVEEDAESEEEEAKSEDEEEEGGSKFPQKKVKLATEDDDDEDADDEDDDDDFDDEDDNDDFDDEETEEKMPVK